MTTSNVTVVVPTYNRVALLRETLQSVLDQTLPVLEIVVVDNGGTDGTERMISQLRNPKIRYERIEPSGGPAKPRNYGVQIAQGSVISFLDSDDLWKPAKIEDELAFGKRTQADIITCLAREYVDGREGPLVRYPIKQGYLSYRDFALDSPVVGANFSIQKNLFLRLGGFDEDVRLAGAEDKDFLLRASAVASFGVVRKVNVLYRSGAGASLEAVGAALFFLEKNKELLELDEEGLRRLKALVRYASGRMNAGVDNERSKGLLIRALASRRLPLIQSLDAFVLLLILGFFGPTAMPLARGWKGFGNDLRIASRRIRGDLLTTGEKGDAI